MITALHQPNERLLEVLDALRARVESGEVRSIAYVAEKVGSVEHGVVGVDNAFRVMGALEYLKYAIATGLPTWDVE
jgi:hypothetical protein